MLLVFFSVSMSAVGQIVMKTGMSDDQIQREFLGDRNVLQILTASLGNGYVITGLFLYAVSALSWLLVLAGTDVSKAYPFVGLGFILTMLMAWFLLNENIGVERIVGTFLVVVGVVLVART